MHLSQLRIFVALVETGSFTEAAFTVNLTQSAVSHALASLEKELGITLIERDRQGLIRISAVGQKILRHAREILTHMETIQQEAALELNQTAGKLRVGSTQFISPCLLAGILAHFQQQYPRVEVILFEGSGLEVYEWINAGIVDVGFGPYDENNPNNTLLVTDEIHVLLPEKHHMLQEKSITQKKLRAEPMIMPKAECDFRQHLNLESPHHKSDNPYNIRYQASDSTTILAMVREGLGITLLPSMLVPEKLENIQMLPLDPPIYMQLGLVVKSQETVSPTAKIFMQVALRWSQEHGFLNPGDENVKQDAAKEFLSVASPQLAARSQ
jgi:DNA-binding transcriptional LysR family regulator